MMMKQRNRVGTHAAQGIGGRRCPCCDLPRKYTKVMRRQVRAAEKRNWKNGI